MLTSGMAYAEVSLGGTSGASTTFGGGIYKPSTNVTVNVASNISMYTAASAHSGALNNPAGKAYATVSSSPQILSVDHPAAVPTGFTAGTLPTGFTP